MNDKILFLFAVFIFSLTVNAQEITETNSDIIYQQALEAYKNEAYPASLKLTKRGLELAPEYHDIRILQIRNLWALEDFSAADSDLDYLMKNVPEYGELKPLVLQRVNRFDDEKEALAFIDRVEKFYPGEIAFQVRRSQIYLGTNRQGEARSLAMDLMSRE